MATYNKDQYAPNIDFSYSVADGYKYKSDKSFTHIIVGASLGFFPNPAKMLDKCVSSEDGGYILAISFFYVTKSLPKELVKKKRRRYSI